MILCGGLPKYRIFKTLPTSTTRIFPIQASNLDRSLNVGPHHSQLNPLEVRCNPSPPRQCCNMLHLPLMYQRCPEVVCPCLPASASFKLKEFFYYLYFFKMTMAVFGSLLSHNTGCFGSITDNRDSAEGFMVLRLVYISL